MIIKKFILHPEDHGSPAEMDQLNREISYAKDVQMYLKPHPAIEGEKILVVFVLLDYER